MKCEICGKDILRDSQCINYKYYHNECIENLQQENKQLKENYERIYNENCKLREEHNITDISLLDENQELKQKYLNSVADYETTMFEKEQLNSLVNSCQEEIRQLKKQLEERPKEYVFIGNAQNKTRDFINQITKDNKEYKTQQKEFMNFLTEAINKLKLKQETSNSAILKANIDLQVEVYSIVLSKYKEIIGV